MSEVKDKYAFFKRNSAGAQPQQQHQTTVNSDTAAPQQQQYHASAGPAPSSSSDSSSSPPQPTHAHSNNNGATPFLRPQQVAIPPRNGTAVSSSASGAGQQEDERNLRRRMASPIAGGQGAYQQQQHDSSFNPSSSSNGQTGLVLPTPQQKPSAVSTPGGKNIVFNLSNATAGTPRGANAQQQQSSQQHQQHSSTTASSSHPPASSYAPIYNPFDSSTKLRGKRKYSDPDIGGNGKNGKNAGKKNAAGSSSTSFLSSTLTKFKSIFKRKDTKKDDDAAASVGLLNHQNGKHANGADGVLDGCAGTGSNKIFGWKNILFFLFMTGCVFGFYVWYTHDCPEDAHFIHSHTPPAESKAVVGQGGHLSPEQHAALNPASQPGGIVESYLGKNVQEFEMMYPFMHPVIHFFKRPLIAHEHTADGEEKDHGSSAVKQQDHVPFTLVSLLRDMTPGFLADNKASYIFQYNALVSWTRLTDHILIYMDTQQACDELTSRQEFSKGIKCFPVPCMHTDIHRPLLNCIFEHSHQHSETEAIGFVNGDIILSDKVLGVVDKVGKEFKKYLVVSRRTDTTLPEYLIDAFIRNYQAKKVADDSHGTIVYKPTTAVDAEGKKVVIEDNVNFTIQYAHQTAVLHSEFGIDLFLYPKSTFQWMFPAFPPFLAGVYRWDNYFLTKMILHPEVSTIDASQFGLLVHQQVDGGEAHSKRTGAPINDALVKQHLGSIYKLGHIKNVDFVLLPGCDQVRKNGQSASDPSACQLTPNVNASVAVLYAKRASASQWLAIIHVNSNEHVELNNFICWSNRIGFRNFIFLTRDQSMYEEIVGRDMPVIYLDRTLVESHSIYTRPSHQDIETSASLLQRYDFLFSVLKAGYHFYYSTVRGIYLDDPLKVLSELLPEDQMYDVITRGNATNILLPPYASPLAVRSTAYGQYFWKQIHDCTDMNKHIADQSQWIDCIPHNWKILKGGVKKGYFNESYFTDAQTFFKAKSALQEGHYPVLIQDESVVENQDKFNRLKQWGLLATKAQTPVCLDDMPGQKANVFKPPTTEPSTDFRLKVRVLTFNRHASLKRLLDALQTANYENDHVDLEISIDYPGNMSDTVAITDWTRTQLTARSFQWQHGSLEVIQQRTHIGLTGQWTQGWYPSEDNKEIMLFLEDDTGVSPYYYTFVKKMILTYYLNPNNYDPNMYGFALQTQHTILGESRESRYSPNRTVPAFLNQTAWRRAGGDPHYTQYFRYQLVGTWGGVFFPQHWREFLIWLREKQFIHAQGVSPIFQPCVPTLVSNAWWAQKPHKVWSQWFVRFAFEKGWYNLYTNYPNQLSLVGNFRESGENFALSKGLMNEMVDEVNTPPGSELYQHIHQPNTFPVPLSNVPLYDFHFNEISNPNSLKYRLKIWGQEQNIPQCLTIAVLLKQEKEAAAKLKLKLERLKKEQEKRESQQLEDENTMKASFQQLEKTIGQLKEKGVDVKDGKKTDAKKSSTGAAKSKDAKKDGDAKKKDDKSKDKKKDDKSKDSKKDGKKDDKKKTDEKKKSDSKDKDKKKTDDSKKKKDGDKKKTDSKTKSKPKEDAE